MPETLEPERHTRAQINTAHFFAYFGIAQGAEYIGDLIHDPAVMDVPRGAVMLLSLGTAAVATLARDIAVRHHDQ